MKKIKNDMFNILPKHFFEAHIGGQVSVITSTVSDNQSMDFSKLVTESFHGKLKAYNPNTDSIIVETDEGKHIFIKEYRRVVFHVQRC